VVVTAGVHWNGIIPEEIQIVKALVDELIDRILKTIKG